MMQQIGNKEGQNWKS